ncbi:MAG: hypothetical protein ACREUX_02325 [Burkholderiales bacterium]
MLQAWKYTAPAFLLPFMFVLDARSIALVSTVNALQKRVRMRVQPS